MESYSEIKRITNMKTQVSKPAGEMSAKKLLSKHFSILTSFVSKKKQSIAQNMNSDMINTFSPDNYASRFSSESGINHITPTILTSRTINACGSINKNFFMKTFLQKSG